MYEMKMDVDIDVENVLQVMFNLKIEEGNIGVGGEAAYRESVS